MLREFHSRETTHLKGESSKVLSELFFVCLKPVCRVACHPTLRRKFHINDW